VPRRAALLLALIVLTVGPALSQEPPAVVPEPPPPEDTAPPPAPAGPVVRAIEIRSEAPLNNLEEIESLIDVQVGEPLTDLDVRRTLRNLQATGVSSDIQFYTREAPEGGDIGVIGVIVIRPVVQVEEIRIEGELGLPEESLREAIPQREGEPLSEDRVVQGVFNLLDAYRAQGYFAATARVDVQTDPVRPRAVLVYNVDAGERAVFGPVAFDGDLGPFTPAELLRRIRLKPNEPYRREVLEDDAERLQDWLRDQQYGTARVDTPREERDLASNTVRVTFPVTVGPRIVLRVIGADERTLRRRGLLPFLGEAGYDEALVLQAASRLKNYYQEQGHYKVQVATEEEPLDGTLRLTIRIEPGPQYTVTSIDLAGNEEVTDETLRGLIFTSERSLLRPGSGRLVESVLEDDVENIRRYYLLDGYTRAEVGPAVIEEDGTDLRIVIPIREGPRQRVVTLKFEGLEALKPEDLLRNLPLKEGGGFHPVRLENAQRAIRAAYADQGYAEAQVSSVTDWNVDQTLVDVTFRVLEGPQRVADRIIVRGNRLTDDEVISRTLKLKRGEPISDRRLLEIERNLYRLGIFSSVDVELARVGLGNTRRDVVVRVEEGRPRRLLYGVGWDSEDGPRGLIGFTHNNVAGRAYSLRTDLRLAESDSRFRVVFNQPYLGERPIELTSTLFGEDTFERDRNYTVVRYGARTEAVRVFDDRRVSVGLDYRNVELDVAPGVAANDIERLDRPYQLTSLVPSFFWDRRDDPIAPTRGWSSLAQLQYAFPAFNTDAEFLKLFVQQTQYLDLRRLGVFAASVRMGGIEPFSVLPKQPNDPLQGLPSSDVFISERFFAGGDATHRAYSRDDLGIRGETLIPNPGGGFDPVGGNGLFILNLEYRFPIFGPVGGTIFYDTGNVWADWSSIDFGDFKQGVGLGVQYLSPIGPLRAGVGWKLDREPGDSAYEFFLNIGNPF
jgi:outer membrane protein insertion porin family